MCYINNNYLRIDSSGKISTGMFPESWTRYVIKMAIVSLNWNLPPFWETTPILFPYWVSGKGRKIWRIHGRPVCHLFSRQTAQR